MPAPDVPEPVRSWVTKAEGDLRSARLLLAADPPESDAAAFHCQQAAEKYLKACLVSLGTEPPRAHDLIMLLDLIALQDERFESLRDEAQPLSPLAVQVRCPFAEATEEEARQALRHAETICSAVGDRLGRRK
jgi:HEPN domain-containing protein